MSNIKQVADAIDMIVNTHAFTDADRVTIWLNLNRLDCDALLLLENSACL